MNNRATVRDAYDGESNGRSAPVDRQDFWDTRACEFSRHAASTGYPGAFIRIMRPHKSWTVLDMACGGGTIAIPLAKKVKSITAVDFSKQMLDIVDWRCRNGGIGNVRALQGRWEDDWDRLGIGVHDVVVASRSLIVDDIKGSIAKLNEKAGKAVFISTSVGPGPFDRRLFESTGRKFDMGRDYIHYYTMLHEMGIMANVTFITEHHKDHWKSHEDAFEDHRWMFHEMTKEEEDKVRTYLKRNLVQVLKHWRLPYSRKCFWAVMWWEKEAGIRQ